MRPRSLRPHPGLGRPCTGALVLALLLLAGCTSGPQPVTWEVVEGCAVDEEGSGTLRTVASLVTFFEDFCSTDAPDLDMGDHLVVWHAMGTQSTGGYSVEISAVERNEDALQVRFLEVAPGDDCMTIQMMTHPTGVFILDTTADFVNLQHERTTRPCG